MDENKNSQIIDQSEITCKQCGSRIHFEPGSNSTKCPNCGTVNEIKIDVNKTREALREIDYVRFISDSSNAEFPQEEQSFLKCTSCGAETTVDANIISTECAFCGTPLVKDQTQIKKVITPSAVVPFKINQKQSVESFNKWLKKLWFLPNKARQYARPDKFQGVYAPYWTYDAATYTHYQGQRGDAYYRTESYRDSDGSTKTREVREIRWSNVSGNVSDYFDDLLIVASKSLPEKYVKRLSKWNLSELQSYDKRFLSGFKAESYNKDVREGYEEAKVIMDGTIESHIRQDIGGDEQRVLSKSVQYNNVTFKHILLPLWLSTYRYNEKVYRFVVNGQSGEVKGERPVSAIKVILFVLLIIAIIVGIVYLTQSH